MKSSEFWLLFSSSTPPPRLFFFSPLVRSILKTSIAPQHAGQRRCAHSHTIDLFDWINQKCLQLSTLIPTSGVNCTSAMEWSRNGSWVWCPASVPSACRNEMGEEEEEEEEWVAVAAVQVGRCTAESGCELEKEKIFLSAPTHLCAARGKTFEWPFACLFFYTNFAFFF